MTSAKTKANASTSYRLRFRGGNTDEVIRGVDLAGQTAIVTGDYSGIGLETTRTLLNAGARVVVAGRDLSKARRALATMPAAIAETIDLMDPVSIDLREPVLRLGAGVSYFGEQCWRNGKSVDAKCPWGMNQFATNHLGHFRSHLLSKASDV